MEGAGIVFPIIAIFSLLIFKGFLVDSQFEENTYTSMESGTIVDKRIKTEVDGGIGFTSGGVAYVPTSTSETFLITVKGSGFIKELEVSHDQYLAESKGDIACVKNYRNKSSKKIVKSEIKECQ